MSRELCQHCCGVGEIDHEPCGACSGNCFVMFTSSKSHGDPIAHVKRAYKDVLGVDVEMELS
jgi:hypothetical protein